jgi:mutator protein MutT
VVTPVAIALVRHNGCYLVGRRGPDGPLADYHEFPGGKCRPGESPEACAVRECREETGLDIEVIRLRHAIEHTYSYGRVRLHFFDCRIRSDSNPAQASAGFAWVPVHELGQCHFPEPNWAVLAELAAEKTNQ